MGFIVEQSRSGQSWIRFAWTDWCNLINAGVGMRPSIDSSTNTSVPIDAIVWVKQPGISDGTTNSSSPDFSSNCTLVRAYLLRISVTKKSIAIQQDSVQYTPEYGQFCLQCLVDLVLQASPPLV